jgi:acetyltransferase-like isoleucine patch superfamily enzyme
VITLRTALARLAAREQGRAARGPIDLTTPELVVYLWQRGVVPALRGWWYRHRLGACGPRLRVGRHVRLLFPRYLTAGRSVALGDYTYLNALSRRGVRLGDFVRIREFGWIQATSAFDLLGEGLSVGEATYIGPRCLLGAGGGITIGRHVTIGADVHVLAENHVFHDPDRLIAEQGVTRRGIVIEDDVWIGDGVIVLDGVRIARGAVVGAGAVVTRDIPPYAVAVGNPARIAGRRERRTSAGS